MRRALSEIRLELNQERATGGRRLLAFMHILPTLRVCEAHAAAACQNRERYIVVVDYSVSDSRLYLLRSKYFLKISLDGSS